MFFAARTYYYMQINTSYLLTSYLHLRQSDETALALRL